MAVTSIGVPSGWSSAYKPIEWSFTSTKAPNIEAGETGFIAEIRNPTAGEIATFPTLSATDVIAIHTPLFNIAFGDYVDIQGTDDELYSGQYRVLEAVAATITRIDATDAGDDTGGSIGKVYRNYTLFANVTFYGTGLNTYKFRVDRDANGIFTVDIQEAAKAQFADIFDYAPKTGGVTVSEADTALALNYDIVITEGYDVPDSDGVLTFTEFKKPSLFGNFGWKIVNNVQPYLHFDEEGDVDFQYTDAPNSNSVPDFVFRSTDTSAATYNKWLTDAPVVSSLKGQADDWGRISLGPNDRYYLGFLSADADAGSNWNVGITRYEADGTPIGNTYVQVTAPIRGGLVSCGPAQLTESSISLTNVAYYTVFMANANEGRISKYFTINIDNTCGRSDFVWYWKNKWGAIDAFHLRGRVEQTNAIERRIQYKPTIKLGGNDFNNRIYGADIGRTYSMTSQLLTREELRWLGDDMAESIDVRELSGASGSETWRWVIPVGSETLASTGYDHRRTRLPLEWTYGHDNRTHRG